jgi:CMP/dCMP kinase
MILKIVAKIIKNIHKNLQNTKILFLKKITDSLLLNTLKLTKRACFIKINKIIDRKIYT